MTHSSSTGGRRALITGASSGLGKAFAERLARDGYDLILVARRLPRLQDLAQQLHKEHGVQVETMSADLNDAAALTEVENALLKSEDISLVINCAGFAGYYPFATVQPAIIDELIGVHIRAVTRTARAALPGMIRRRQGGIINISGLLAFAANLPPTPLPPRAVYAGAKAYLLAFTQTLAGETRGTGVRVQVCIPGRIETDFHAIQGIDTSKQPPAMSAQDVVMASLAALARDETVCVPGLADPALLDALNNAQLTVFRTAAMQSTCAERYRSALG
ncbi:MAG TPA: SDR family NAD(P)-dependent oxidoreductase [Rhizomicrobium sp.]|jgi:hypothetical protein